MLILWDLFRKSAVVIFGASVNLVDIIKKCVKINENKTNGVKNKVVSKRK